MHVFMSWARSTATNIERLLGRSEDYFDRILIGVLGLLALAVRFIFAIASTGMTFLLPVVVTKMSAVVTTSSRPPTCS